MPFKLVPFKESLRAHLLDEYQLKLDTYMRVEQAAKAILEYNLLPLVLTKKAPYERIEVLSRIKSFESAFGKIWNARFADIAESMRIGADIRKVSFVQNRDMVGIKIRAFPNERVLAAEAIVKEVFRPKPENADHNDEIGMKKYFVSLPDPCPLDLREFMFEIQIKPYLIDAYHDIEHDLIYKSRNKLMVRLMEGWDQQVVNILKGFAIEFEKIEREVLPLLPKGRD